MRTLLALLFILMLSACSDCEDCADYEINELKGIVNESGSDVEITFYMENSEMEGTFMTVIKDGDSFMFVDTSRGWNVLWCQCGLYVNGCNSSMIDVKMKILGDSPKCISFAGPVQDEKTDIRVIDSYKKVGEPVSTTGGSVQAYEYIISPNLLKQVGSCE